MARFKAEIDSSHVPVEGPAGLGLVVAAAFVVYVLAPLRSVGVVIALGGAVIGLILLAMRHRETRPAAVGGLVLAGLALIAVVLVRVLGHS